VSRYLAFFIIFCLFGCSEKKEKKEERIFFVELADVQVRDVPIIIEAIGNIFANQVSEIYPQVTGVVTNTLVYEGAYVKKDDVIYQIDPSQYQYALDKAKGQFIKDQAALDIAKFTVDSYSALVEKDFVAKLNFEQFKSNLEQAKGQIMIDKANIETAELNLAWTEIKAPFDGKISQFNIDVGNLVVANSTTNPLTTIRTLTPADVQFYLNQKDFLRLQEALNEKNLTFEVSLPQKPSYKREGYIYFIDNALSLTTGTVLVKGYVENSDDFFWPGEFINVRLKLKTDPNAIVIPQEAIKMNEKGPYVFVFDETTSKVYIRSIIKGETLDSMTVVKKGLAGGEKVVLKGQLNLKDGLKVKVKDQR
jgi:multidrug efflux system membrane fusion protein